MDKKPRNFEHMVTEEEPTNSVSFHTLSIFHDEKKNNGNSQVDYALVKRTPFSLDDSEEDQVLGETQW